jgi:hypothetical protein
MIFQNFMKYENIDENKYSNILQNMRILKVSLLQKCGFLILVILCLFFASFVLAQDLPLTEGKVYVCPLATKMEEVNPWCDCRIDLVLSETVTSTCETDGKTYEMTLTITEYEGEEYYAILGFENGGAGINLAPQASAGGPYEGFIGEKILIDASKSIDQNSDPLKFRFDFEGDGRWDTDWQDTPTIEKVFNKEFEGKLNVEVSDGMFQDIAQSQIKISKNLSSPIGGNFSCECKPWGEWIDKGCGRGNCSQNEMLRERERECSPKSCDFEKERQCSKAQTCSQISEKISQKIIKTEKEKSIAFLPEHKEKKSKTGKISAQPPQRETFSQPKGKFPFQDLLATLQIAFKKNLNFLFLISTTSLILIIFLFRLIKKRKKE